MSMNINETFEHMIEEQVQSRLAVLMEQVIKPQMTETIAAEIKALDLTALQTPKAQTIVIKQKGKPTKKIEGLFHHKFTDVMLTIKAGCVTLLSGETGSGKTFLCKQVADALELDFYLIGTTTQEHKLVGYVDAVSEFQMSQLYKAVVNGGLFVIDEIDSFCPNVSLLLNSLLSNGYIEFPSKGLVYAHPDFRVIACANTLGEGATRDYVGRNPMDGAFKARFTALATIDIDLDLELAFSNDIEFTLKIQEHRKAIKLLGMRHILSPRQSNDAAKCLALGMSVKSVDEMFIWRGMKPDDINKVKSKLKDMKKAA